MLESPPASSVEPTHEPGTRHRSQRHSRRRRPLGAGPRVHARPVAGALRGRGGSVLPVDAVRGVGARGRHREARQPQYRAGRRGAGGERREERVRVLRRARFQSADARRVGRAQHRPGGRRRPRGGVARLVRAGALRRPRPDRVVRRERANRPAGARRRGGAAAQPPRPAGHRQPRRRVQPGAGRLERRHVRRRRPPAGENERERHRRARRPARAGIGRRGRTVRLPLLHRGGPRVGLRARGRCARGARQPGGGGRAGRHHDRGARPGLARGAPARGGRTRARGRLQPQGQLGVRGPHGRAGRERGSAPWLDDGTLERRRGSLTVDDEGDPDPVHHPSSRTAS